MFNNEKFERDFGCVINAGYMDGDEVDRIFRLSESVGGMSVTSLLSLWAMEVGAERVAELRNLWPIETREEFDLVVEVLA